VSLLGVDVLATDGQARTTTVTSPRGTFTTPAFMPVGTRGAVKHLTSADLEDLGAEVVLANTYHLMLRPGADVVAELGGLHGLMDWTGHTLTDSGGYQVFSLKPRVDDDGATFISTYDGSKHHLSPEKAVEVQQLLGADIQMVLDVCPPLPSPPAVLRAAVERTALWASRAKAAHSWSASRQEGGPVQALFGIVQGGTDVGLRAEAAQRTRELDFDGYGIGGLSVGESRGEMLPALAAALEHLPADVPRYLMGVGDPVGMVEAVALGIDMFDCVLPSRHARHGTLLTAGGRLNLKNARYLRDPEPPDPGCACPTCQRWSRGYLRHLMQVNEPTAGRLLTVHNVHWILDLVRRMQRAVADGTFACLRREILEVWGT
jgi:queuine tRNA-ribosyltransferase